MDNFTKVKKRKSVVTTDDEEEEDIDASEKAPRTRQRQDKSAAVAEDASKSSSDTEGQEEKEEAKTPAKVDADTDKTVKTTDCGKDLVGLKKWVVDAREKTYSSRVDLRAALGALFALKSKLRLDFIEAQKRTNSSWLCVAKDIESDLMEDHIDGDREDNYDIDHSRHLVQVVQEAPIKGGKDVQWETVRVSFSPPYGFKELQTDDVYTRGSLPFRSYDEGVITPSLVKVLNVDLATEDEAASHHWTLVEWLQYERTAKRDRVGVDFTLVLKWLDQNLEAGDWSNFEIKPSAANAAQLVRVRTKTIKVFYIRPDSSLVER